MRWLLNLVLLSYMHQQAIVIYAECGSGQSAQQKPVLNTVIETFSLRMWTILHA